MLRNSDDDSIAVFVRVRNHDGGRKSITTNADAGSIVLHTPSHEDRAFAFDRVGGEDTTQQDVFEAVGQPLSDACMSGYNGAIFAYGQTGSGKTYTMYGPAAAADERGGAATRGLTPRVLDYIFAWMARDERKTDGQLSYRCTASLLEIYNEHITDLLEPPEPSVGITAAGGHGGGTGAGLKLREDATRGIYVENLTLEAVDSAEAAQRLLTSGMRNRAVAATAMNAESSRSHLVFTLNIAATHEAEGGIRRVRSSQLHLVDLAGRSRL